MAAVASLCMALTGCALFSAPTEVVAFRNRVPKYCSYSASLMLQDWDRLSLTVSVVVWT